MSIAKVTAASARGRVCPTWLQIEEDGCESHHER
jgi:hypothetical protein